MEGSQSQREEGCFVAHSGSCLLASAFHRFGVCVCVSDLTVFLFCVYEHVREYVLEGQRCWSPSWGFRHL